jgi:hypothetical protein
MIFAILPLSLLAGLGLQAALPNRRWAFIIAALVLSAATLELTSYAAVLSQQAFILNPVPAQSPAPAPLAHTINQHIVRVNGVDYSRAYAGTLAGYGTLSYCSVLGPEPSVRVIEDPDGSPYLTGPRAKGQAELISWSPNEIRVRASLNEANDVILKSNYAPGWWVTEETSNVTASFQPANEVSGRLAATALTPGRHDLIFIYRAPGLPVGIALTTLTLFAAGSYLGISLYYKVRQRRT